MTRAAILIALSLAASNLAAQDSLSRARRVDSLLAAYDFSAGPGAAVGVVQNGKVLYNRGYGLADIEHATRVTGATVFDVASVSKQFTGLAVAMLVEQGRIGLADDIRKYIPEMHDFGRPITIDNLLHHTSGLRDWPATLQVGGARMDDIISFGQILAMAFRQRTLNFAPGSEYSYSNTEYNLLAEVVARVTGQSFRAWTDEHLFRPLAMTSTHFRDDIAEPIDNRAYGYASVNGRYQVTPDNLLAEGSSSLLSNTTDMLKWLANLDKPAVGGRSAVDLMRTETPLNNGARNNYAFGMVNGMYRGIPTVAHDGSWASFSTFDVLFPTQHLGVVVLANSGASVQALAFRIASIYLAIEPAPVLASTVASVDTSAMPPVDVAPATLDAYAGVYQLGPGWFVRLRRDGNHLMTQATREDEFPVASKSESVFWVPGYSSSMVFRRSGDTTYLTYHGATHPRLPDTPTFTAEQLKEFAGEYYSDELQATYRVEVRNGGLVMLHPRFGVITLTRQWGDEFTGNAGFMNPTFQRNQSGAITGFTVSAGGRSRNNQFLRKS